jgi:hypothetical protein
MNPRLKHLEAVVARTRGTQKVIRVAGGIPGAPVVRVDCGDFTLIGPMADLQIEDGAWTTIMPQAPAQAPSQATG